MLLGKQTLASRHTSSFYGGLWHILFLLSESECKTLIWESQQGWLLCSRGPTALAVWLLQVEWGATKVVSHCCIDRCSNYILLHSAPISIQHQHTPLNSIIHLPNGTKAQHSMVFGTQKETLTPAGVRHQIVSWSRRLQETAWLLIYGFRVAPTRWIILILARVHLKALTLALTGFRSL